LNESDAIAGARRPRRAQRGRLEHHAGPSPPRLVARPGRPRAVLETAAALNAGYHLAYLIGAALLGVAVLISLTVLRAPRPAPAHEPSREPVAVTA
jgi:hypothetical protein